MPPSCMKKKKNRKKWNLSSGVKAKVKGNKIDWTRGREQGVEERRSLAEICKGKRARGEEEEGAGLEVVGDAFPFRH
ncbi:hypothetical protein Cni_G29174 [Canna indica]|uniref:Uncharacterized protein n=1 Tax=Canna indica TaxID=4628 RepID=A0AAQ3QR07_9LILI|nr:hypothetical protein Cni_G29174 [Canna indica]